MKTDKFNALLLWLNIIGFLGTVIVNGLSTALPLNNKTPAEISDQYPNLFVPAGLTFSVWGVIYILLAAFVVYHIIATVKKDTQALSPFSRIGLMFFAASVLNMGWIFAWHYEIMSLSLVIMFLLLGCLLVIYLRLGIGKAAATKKERYLIRLPFSIYLGWITIATIANVTAFLVYIDWNRFGLSEHFWAVVVIVVGIAIALSILVTRRDAYYCLVVDWALLGILLKRLADNTTSDQSVIITTILGMSLISLGIAVQIARRKVY